MWEHAEVVGLLDREGRVRVVSRNESEAVVARVVGRLVVDLLAPGNEEAFIEAFQQALHGKSTELRLAGLSDAGEVYWGRVRLMPSPDPESPVLYHMRRLPLPWGRLSTREQEVIHALRDSEMNSKRAAKKLGISLHTLNAHRRSICQKCELDNVGEFWVFVQRCR